MLNLDLDSLWQYIIESFSKSLNPASYKAWFGPAEPVQYIDQTLIVNVPTTLHRDYLTQKLNVQISDLIQEVSG